MIPGQVVEVRIEARGSQLIADLGVGATSIAVEDPTPFDDAGGQVKVGDTIYTYSDVAEYADPDDPDNTNGLMLLSSPATIAEAAGAPVALWSGAQVLDDVILVVDIGDEKTVDVYATSGQRKDWTALAGGVDPPIAVLVAPDLSTVMDAPGFTPPTRLEAASVASLYPNGTSAASMGPVTEGQENGYGFFLNTETGQQLFAAYRFPVSNVSAFNIIGVDQVIAKAGFVALGNASFSHSLVIDDGGITVLSGTTSSSANAVIDPSTHLLLRSTSSRRYKQDIEDLNVDPAAVLQMRPRTWRDRLEVEADPDTTVRHVGFIAEELAELGLHDFVSVDADGQPEAIAYDRLAVGLLAVAQKQQRDLDDLRDRLDALERRDA